MLKTLFFLTLCANASIAAAGLINSYTFNGNGNWSIDAAGCYSPLESTLSAQVPASSFIEQAYLYAPVSFDLPAPSISLASTNYSGAAWSDLGTTGVAGLRTYRTDVTQQMRSAIGSGSAAPFGFQVTTTDSTGNIEGTTLAIVYSNAGEARRNIALYDGFVPVGGTTVNHPLPAPLDPGLSGFESLLSLGIAFSVGNVTQLSRVDINGRRLSSTAGGEDDAERLGSLLTTGGLGDSPLNPPNPFHIGSTADPYDDELYNLALGHASDSTPYVSAGDTQISLFIENPGAHDDLDFFVGFNTVVPEPSTVVLATLGALACALYARAGRSKS